MARALLLVLDSVGIGGAEDAEAYGDRGADTLGHIAEACAAGRGDRPGLRSGPLRLPNLDRLGLALAAQASLGKALPEPNGAGSAGLYGFGVEASKGKDTPSGHWEIAGVPVRFDWGYFPQTVPTFPAALTEALIREGQLPGILGNQACLRHRDHRRARRGAHPDAASRSSIPRPTRCSRSPRTRPISASTGSTSSARSARKLVDPLNIGRVIARPFLGETMGDFERTANRRDYAVPPPEPTLLDRAVAAGRKVVGVGKIGDIFAHRGVSEVVKAPGNEALFDATLAGLDRLGDGDLLFANFVDFDMLYGHRRDIPGYAAALEAFDRRLPALEARLKPGDLCIITADHGCDPTWKGTDHTREHVPILAFGPGIAGGAIGGRAFADMGETIAAHLGLPPGRYGRSFL